MENRSVKFRDKQRENSLKVKKEEHERMWAFYDSDCEDYLFEINKNERDKKIKKVLAFI